jgi:putative FmdB family regulatory protein
MPIFDFRCPSCSTQFEALVRGNAAPACPSCGDASPERLLSIPALKSDARTERIRAETKRRDTAVAKDRAHEQRKYEQSHDD